MRKILTGLLMPLAAVFIYTACQRDLQDPRTGSGTPSNPVNDNVMVTAGVRGIVIDENNQPVSGITVTSGAASTTTNRYGMFVMNNISLSKNNGSVKVQRPGYFTAIKSFVTTAGRIHEVRIRLIPKTNSGNFSGSVGGTVSLPSGAKLVIPANAVSDASGNPFTGQVNVAMTWIDPSASNLPELVPGDLRGITTAGEERGLSTYGMIGVELTDGSGQLLKISTGKTAELTFPVPAAVNGSAPATIDLWHFDEATARWKQEGTAAKTGNLYIAQVSHFSFWNCDAQFPLVNLCMTIVNSGNATPLNNVQVRIKRPNGTYGYGWTDSAGNLCGKVPSGEALVLEVMDQCNNAVYTQNIGPFSGNASLGTISATIPATNTLTITGTVTDCANANVTNGAAIIYTGGAYGYTVPVQNGTFSLTLLSCGGTTIHFTVLGVDLNAVQQSVPVSGSAVSGTVNVGTIQACGTSSAQYIELIINGTPYNYAAPPNIIGGYDSLSVAYPGYANHTTIYASSQQAGATGFCNIGFYHNGLPGTVPLATLSFYIDPVVQGWDIIGPVPQVMNLTSIQPVPGFVEGNTNVVINSPTMGVVNVQCNFRARRL